MRKGPRFAVVALTYVGFVVYGSLVPLAYRYRPFDEAWATFLHTPYLRLGMGSRADWVANILLYIPLGFLATASLATRMRAAPASVAAFGLCVLLAIAVEFAQLFFPPRTVSLNDLLAELLGAGLGIALWHSTGERLVRLWDEMQTGGRHGTRALIALYTAAYLGFSLFPYDFLVSATELAQKLASPGRSGLFTTESCGGLLGCGTKLFSEVLTAAPLGAFLAMTAATGNKPGLLRAFAWGIVLGVVIEGMQTFLASGVSQGASILTRGAGMALGVAIYRFFRREWLVAYRSQLKIAVFFALPLYIVLLLTLNGFFSSRFESTWVAVAKLREVRFLPFYYHYYTSETEAMRSLLIHAGAYAPVGLMVWIFRDGQGGRTTLWLCAFIAALTALPMEALKLFLHGKKPDPTDVLIAAAAASLAGFAATRLAHWQAADTIMSRAALPEIGGPRKRSTSARRGLRAAMLAGGALVAAVALAGWVIGIQPREHYVDESKLPRLPAPQDLPSVTLPGFKFVHPRLPTPSPLELSALTIENPNFIGQVRNRARGGKGDIEAAVLQELIEPGRVDLGVLHRRLMKIRFSRRGDAEGKLLALAYDWLYSRWSDSERAELRGKLVQGCEYLIDFIRKERLSPYNVILYNSPFQALMACSLAIYGDDPRSDQIMRFTFDLWKNRVLPAWRQIMGRNGGWHEGGEYVSIGIGQAVYQLPAMWRHATGEDLFATEPGIRGFLDFLVYRIRPDGTYFRWGDGNVFDRIVPDAVPLALELRHAAAYNLRPPQANTPSGWPWGPITGPALIDPSAVAMLPLTRYFDGIGMLVARSDWTPQATYVTFKAGDNFWSHVHLDQGAFTIYKGGPLAIDSGFYGPRYGSDHHMNYAYQAIAHNTITVTDPDDTVPAPDMEKPRPIANDGGQRRIGSGWGVEPAPLDRAEWEAKRDIYHTASIEQFFDHDGLSIAVADVTPAYTNSRSGKGTFSHRTRRVEQFWRTFGYDRVDDVVVVFDQVTATRASFRKRWLLHTIDEPLIAGSEFVVGVPAQDRMGRAGGRLEAKVLLPRDAVIHTIGGRGFEFFVNDRNYDENGTVQNVIKQLGPNEGEPGAWRVEVSPALGLKKDLFLVVLLPTAADEVPTHDVRLLESGNRVGCEIVGPNRTTRWWFEAGRNGVEIEVSSHGEERRYAIEGRSITMPPSQSWLDRVRSWIGTRL